MAEQYKIENPFPNGFADKDDPVVLQFLKKRNSLIPAISQGNMHVKFVSGDRKGSIAKVHPDQEKFGDNAVREAKIRWRVPFFGSNDGWDVENLAFYLICTWEGRRNKVRLRMPHHEAVFLLDYTGPTVWEKFDAAAVKKQVLEKPMQRDIDGQILSVGDTVLFINARYGSAMQLDHGTIKEFEVTANSRSTSVSTVVENREGLLSTISNSDKMIYKGS